jgi:23S rRNA (adenine2503-C2)-methyltransferase
MKHLLDTIPKLQDWLRRKQQPTFRAGQIIRWIFEKRIHQFSEMTDLPESLRELLTKHFEVFTTELIEHSSSSDGTEKLLLRLQDGGVVECVLLRDEKRRTICVSSQVGCAMGCVFCASGLDGVMRNLTAGEITEQMLRLQSLLPEDERLSHIVMMGMGEPLANLDSVLRALDLANSATGLGISSRRITISTVGLPAAIRRMSRLDCKYQLAVSLHAPNDELRNELVPVNSKVGIDTLMSAVDDYFRSTGRKLTFEYVLLAGINDQPEHAMQLRGLLENRTALLNVIPYNPVEGLPYQTPSARAIRTFKKIMEGGGIEIRFRQRKGDSINAACGQLRRKQLLALDAVPGEKSSAPP